MKLFGFVTLQLAAILFSTPHTYAQSESVGIKSVELIRRGSQVSVHLLTDRSPSYEVSANLTAQTLVVKFHNAYLDFSDSRSERLFNDEQVAGIRFYEVEDQIWAQFKLRQQKLTYEVSPLKGSPGLAVVFRSVVAVKPEPETQREAFYKLSGIRFEPGNGNRTRFLFSFRIVTSSFEEETPEIPKIPRIFLLEDKSRNRLTIRFPDTLPEQGLQVAEFAESRIQLAGVRSEVNQTFVDLDLTIPEISVEHVSDLDNAQWVLYFSGETQAKEEKEVPAKTLSEEEKKAAEKETRAALRRKLLLKSLFQQAENTFRQGDYNESIRQFRAAYAQGKADAGEFEEPLDEVAAQAMFRAADVTYTMLERGKAKNHHRAIEAYQTAVRIAKTMQTPSPPVEAEFIVKGLIPHAYFRIGRSYQKMQFHNEASRSFVKLKNEYPNSREAIESIFWRAVTHIDSRNWKDAIDDFKEYLRTSPAPKFLAVTHYKLAQAYYQQGRFIIAREHFDQGRNLNTEYVKQDPTLLFHMGETYYENADYTTAREVFKILLRLYPDADFSKFVALRLGDFLRDEGKEDEAITVYKNAINSYSREIALLGKLRIANIQAKRPFSTEYLEALGVYEEIVNLYPDSTQAEEALLRQGLTQTLYGFYREAIMTLEKFMDLHPESVYVRRNVIQENIDENLKGMIDQYFRKEDDLALVAAYRDYKSKYMLNFRFDTTLFQVAVAHRRLGFHDDALDLFRFLETRASGTMAELIQLEKAQTLFEKKDYPEARDNLARFLQDHPESLYDAEVHQLLAMVYRRDKQFSKALIVYEQTIEKYDQDQDPLKAEIVPELYYELAQMLEDAGYFADAANAYLQSITRYSHPVTKPGTPEYIIHSHFLAGEMLYKVQNNEASLAQFEKAIGVYGSRTEPEIRERIHWARYHTGNLYAELDQKEKALKIYKDLKDSKEGEGSLWKKMSKESHQSLGRQMSYQNYLQQ